MPPKSPPKRRRQSRQASIQFHAAGHGGARPGAGRPRTRRSRVPHRSRGGVPGHCPVLITLRVRDDVPRLRCARFVRAFRETLRKGARRPGFRVAHYSIQDDHAHFLVEAHGKVCLANGMKSLGGRFARCANRVFGRRGRVLAGRFHHAVKRTPTEVRRALAYVLLNARKHYRQRRRRVPPVVLDGARRLRRRSSAPAELPPIHQDGPRPSGRASSGLWFDGWKGRAPPAGRYADGGRECEVAVPRSWLLARGRRRIGLIDPSEVPGAWRHRRGHGRRNGSSVVGEGIVVELTVDAGRVAVGGVPDRGPPRPRRHRAGRAPRVPLRCARPGRRRPYPRRVPAVVPGPARRRPVLTRLYG